ncbi:MAG: TetR/AcrR family transcriptional regulator [Desulfobacterales bacterium]|jgi:AcrR family transcriptional regulator
MEQQKEIKRNQIVAAAARVFARSGYSNAVIADIAMEANIGKGTVYEYFESKEDLFFAVFEWFQKKMEKAAAAGLSSLGDKATERLKGLNDSLMGLWDEIKDVFVLVMEFWSASSSTRMRQRFKAAFKQIYVNYRLIVCGLIQDGIDGGEFRPDVKPEPIAAALVGTWDALFLQAWFDENFDPAATARDFLETVLRGLVIED